MVLFKTVSIPQIHTSSRCTNVNLCTDMNDRDKANKQAKFYLGTKIVTRTKLSFYKVSQAHADGFRRQTNHERQIPRDVEP